MKKKHTKAYFQYVEIINTLDIEQTTSVECEKLIDEIIDSNELKTSEVMLLLCIMSDRGISV